MDGVHEQSDIMTGLTQCAPAKLNLALHVRERRHDGYHIIETIFAFVRDGDVLSISAQNEGCSLDIIGPFSQSLSAGADNLVLRAALALADAADITPNGHFTLDKRLPIASGIGGGSADAATALRLANAFWGLNWPVEKLAAIGLKLGADIPACLRSTSCYGAGIGEDLQPIIDPEWQGLPLLLVNPLKQVSTAQIFANWDQQDRGALSTPVDMFGNIVASRNDLEPIAKALCPDIIVILEELAASGPILSRMSGSGATCFAVYKDARERDAAENRINQMFPEAWTMTSWLHDWDFSNGE